VVNGPARGRGLRRLWRQLARLEPVLEVVTASSSAASRSRRQRTRGFSIPSSTSSRPSRRASGSMTSRDPARVVHHRPRSSKRRTIGTAHVLASAPPRPGPLRPRDRARRGARAATRFSRSVRTPRCSARRAAACPRFGSALGPDAPPRGGRVAHRARRARCAVDRRGARSTGRRFDAPYRTRRRISAPTYPFQRERYWPDESSISRRTSSVASGSPLPKVRSTDDVCGRPRCADRVYESNDRSRARTPILDGSPRVRSGRVPGDRLPGGRARRGARRDGVGGVRARGHGDPRSPAPSARPALIVLQVILGGATGRFRAPVPRGERTADARSGRALGRARHRGRARRSMLNRCRGGRR
jgi:hypothetical protein